jgi:16S rRNA (adenine1518-N6/adenine1519-N6)-dimethyltransferase
LNVSANKKLGQHFLRDGRVIGRIANVIIEAVKPADTIIEIGPGTGALTTPLLPLPNQMVLLEKDHRCIEVLNALLAKHDKPATLANADALKADWQALAGQGAVVVGNLPYNVGTEIVASLLHAANAGVPVRRMFFMLQKEVVQRICAKPGNKNWGRLGVLSHLLSDCRSLFDIPPGAFNPPPKVMSSIVDITPLPAPRYKVDMAKLDRLLRLAFGQKRKMLRASLREALEESTIAQLGIDPAARPETLSTEQLCKLANAL